MRSTVDLFGILACQHLETGRTKHNTANEQRNFFHIDHNNIPSSILLSAALSWGLPEPAGFLFLPIL